MSPRRAVVTRESVLEVAGRLFREKGIRGTGVADVIAAAGCGKQAFYRVFESKDDLVTDYLRSRVAVREAATAAALRSEEEPLVALIDELAAWTGQPGFRGCVVRNYLREYPDDGAAKRFADDFLRRSYARVLDLCDGDEAVADRVWLVHEGLYAAPGSAGAGAGLIRALQTG